MPALSDILQYARGQLFVTPSLPAVSFAGQTIAITGANTGLGFECAKHLVQLGVSTLVLGCRNIEKGQAARRQLLSGAKAKVIEIHVWHVDMAAYDSVKAFATRLNRDIPRLDGLLVNAGISTNEFSLAEGLESTLTINVVSSILLGVLVLPKLQSTASEAGRPTHLTFSGSVVHCFVNEKQLFDCPPSSIFSALTKDADMGSRYFLSKLILLQCVRALATSGGHTKTSPDVIINYPNPGWCKTELFRQDDGGAFARNLLRLIGRTAEIGARSFTSAIASSSGFETHGQYLSENVVKKPSAFVRSPEGRTMQIRLWSELLELLEDTSPGLKASLV